MASTHVRECSARLRDGDGIERETVVHASSVLEAAALGLARLPRAEWSMEVSLGESRMLVEARESTFYRVPISNAEWRLKRNDVKVKLPEDRWRLRGSFAQGQRSTGGFGQAPDRTFGLPTLQ